MHACIELKYVCITEGETVWSLAHLEGYPESDHSLREIPHYSSSCHKGLCLGFGLKNEGLLKGSWDLVSGARSTLIRAISRNNHSYLTYNRTCY